MDIHPDESAPSEPAGSKNNRFWHWFWITMVIIAGICLATANVPAVGAEVGGFWHNIKIHQLAYEAKNGDWVKLDIPGQYQINAIHATEFHSTVPGWSDGLLIMAGSGNNQTFFNNGTFRTIILNPATGAVKNIPTPWDAFCAGHIQLPDGNILIAGGTARYEDLDPVYAAGAMTVVNTDTTRSITLPRGTIFVSPKGVEVKTAFELTIPAARAHTSATGVRTIVNSQQDVWVDAVARGNGSVVANPARYNLQIPNNLVYGLGTAMTLQKQNFLGTNDAYIFNVSTLKYQKINSMNYARWYPTLTEMGNGMVMTTSGLNNVGQVNTANEWFNPQTGAWTTGPQHGFPTYPALFLTMGGQLLYTGSNAGYGPATPAWREPGIWNPYTNKFKALPGIPDPNMLETSASVLLPPAQAQRYMVLGGGGVGQSNLSTARTAIINLNSPDPKWMQGPNMAEPTRYPITVILPNDDVLVTGGSTYYRGMHNSDNRDTRLYDPSTNTFSWAASSITGRDYHSGGILMANGTVVTFGGNPLFGDPSDSTPQTFNHEIDVYMPPYLFTGTARPAIKAVPTEMRVGHSYTMLATPGTGSIKSLRLMKPGNPTHVTDVNLRSIAVPFKRLGGTAYKIAIPNSSNLVPPGWYMLFATNTHGVPSIASWVHIQ